MNIKKQLKELHGALALLAVAGTGVLMMSAHGATVTVSDADALATALAGAASGDVVEVADGTYSPSATLVVPSGVTLRAQNGLGRVVFTPAGGGVSPVISATDKTCVIEGFVISNYVYSATGNVVYLGKGGKIVSCRLTRNTLYGSNLGGTIACGANTVVSQCIVDNNDTTGGGTSAFGVDWSGSNGSVTVDRTLVYGNKGGIIAAVGTWTFTHCTIADNLKTGNASDSIFQGYDGRKASFTDCVLLFSSLPGKCGLNGITTKDNALSFTNCYYPGIAKIVPAASTGVLTSGDVKFVNPWSGDYHLEAGSVLIGAASDGGDIGCYAYDANYVPTHPVVELAAGADLKAAVDAAAEGTVLKLAEGEYAITEMVTVDKPIRVVGAGRDKTILRADGLDHRTLKIHNYRAMVEGVTITGANCSLQGAAVWIGAYGGCFANSRVTDCVARSSYGGTLDIGDHSVLYNCVIDGNAHANSSGVIGTSSGCAGVNVWNGDKERDLQGVLIDHCLIANNRGYSLYVLNDGPPTSGETLVQDCTLVGEQGFLNVNTSRGFRARRSIFLAATEKPFKNLYSINHYENRKVNLESCFYRTLESTNTLADAWCVQADDPMFVNPRGGDYRLRAGSPCIGAAEDGSDIGCYAYDKDADATIPSVELTDGGDLAAAVAAAADGTDIKLGAGVYKLSEGLVIGKPIRIVGASRDSVFIQPADGVDSSSFRMLTLSNVLARVENVTLRRASGGAVYSYGGVMEDCRITECECSSAYTVGWAAYLKVGYMNRCLIDKNTNIGKNANSILVTVRSNAVEYRLIWRVGLIENTLIQNNTSTTADGKTACGTIVYSDTGDDWRTAGYLRNVTVAGNVFRKSLSAGEYVRNEDQIANCIFWDAPVTYSEKGKKLGAISHCVLYSPDEATTTYATNCLTVDPQVRASGKLRATSPCLGAAKVFALAAKDLDFAGNPRVSKNGTQDIGCLQYTDPAGLMLIIR